MLDLGASINVMPTSVYNNLDLGPLQNTGLIIQLANRSNTCPIGVVEDVPVQVNNLLFPADFYILDMAGETNSSRSPIILGRPFMKTAKTKIDVDDGTMSMEFGDVISKFNLFDAMKHPMEEHSVFHIGVLSESVDDTFELFSTEFPSLSTFDNTYSCDSSSVSVFAENEAAPQVDIVSTGKIIDEEAAYDIPTRSTIPSIRQPLHFDTFTYPRLFFDPGIKGEGGYYPKLLHQNSILKRVIVEEPSLARVAHAITYPP